MSSKYFESYSFEIPGDSNTRKQKLTFTGPHDYIESLRQKPIEITSAKNVNGWYIKSKGYSDGTVRITAEKNDGNKTLKIEQITPNTLDRFVQIEIDDYSPYDSTEFTSNTRFVEVSNKEGKSSPEFEKINEQSEKQYERRLGSKSSIIEISNFLYDAEFEKILKEVS